MKKFLSIALALALLLAAPIHAAGSFSDVREADWFASYVETARSKGIVSGYPDGSFKPSRQVSYGEFLAMAMRGKGTDPEQVEGNAANSVHWARKFYDAAAGAEIFSETQIGSRKLDEPIPRRDMALIMAGLLANAGCGGVNVKTADKVFSDVAATDEREYPIALCNYYGVLSGYPDGSFRPLGFLTRAEASAAMVALDGIVGESAAAEVLVQEPQVAEEPAGQPETQKPAAPKEPAKAKEPKTREELLARQDEPYLVKTGDTEVLTFMDPKASTYLQEVIASTRFVMENGKYVVKVQWPGLPEGCGGKIDVQVCNKNGTGLDGYVWVCRKGMENIPTYRKDLKTAGSDEFVFDLANLKDVGYVALLVTVFQESGTMESNLALAQQDFVHDKINVQFKVASDDYALSGTLPLEENIFLWK
ncbi:MAG: S-layer homology domain-containing protein [Firmicutes bacterium]|nr:S-layer homology domain-containing protein [Bacillota bacterium]